MKSKHLLSNQDKQLFKETIGKVKTIPQDTIYLSKSANQVNRVNKVNKQFVPNQLNAEFYFSDQYQAHFNSTGPIKYVRHDVSSYAAKYLRNGYYSPTLILDLHGYNQQQAKREIAALLAACPKEHAECVCIVHGIGSRVLKNSVPHWLVQHPSVQAFHQAPLVWGGAGALLVLVDID